MTKVRGNFFKTAGVNSYMKLLKTPLFTTLTVDELLWGYEDRLLAKVATSDRTVDKIFGLMYKASIFLPKMLSVNQSELLRRFDLTCLCVCVCVFRKTGVMTERWFSTLEWRTTWITAALRLGKEKG